MKVLTLIAAAALASGLLAGSSVAVAQQDQPAADPAAEARDDGRQPTPADLIQRLERYLTGAKFVGNFTIQGREGDSLPKEEYTILKAEKQDKEDWWLLNARIKYGDKDVTVPVPLRIKWADDTPVISMTNLAIPTLGTFSCRVVIHNGKYAGTWTHDEVGGHLFGTIEPAAAEKEE